MKIIQLLGFVIALVIGAQSASAQDDYTIRVGDVLQVEVVEDASLNRAVAVLPSGQISFPFAGTLQAAGRTIAQMERTLRSAISAQFASPPTVFINVQPFQDLTGTSAANDGPTLDVFFLGAVNTPGRLAVPPGTTFLQAIAMGGGVNRFAATKRLQLRRSDASGAQRVSIINYKALTAGAVSNDIELKDGDVILVPERRLFE